MSSNYRILLYFLSTLNDSLRVGLGLRNTQNYYSRLNDSIRRAEIKKHPRGNLTNTFAVPSPRTNRINLRAEASHAIENCSLVAEGLRQYVGYATAHASKRTVPIALDRNYALPKIDRAEKLPTVDSVPPVQINKQQEAAAKVVNTPQVDKVEKVIENIAPRVQETETNGRVNGNKNSIYSQANQAQLSSSSRERKIPSNRASRVLSFGGLALSLGVGAVEELTKRVVGASSSGGDSILGSSLFLSEANARKIVDTLCRVRGAALKLGQLLSIQDSEVVGPEIQAIFERVRQSADYMPPAQMRQVMVQQLGPEWKSLFKSFEEKPFAAASIGQVHQAELHDGTRVAVKIQYPGVAESIESDIKNVLAILKYANVFPEGLFIDHIMAYAKKELSWEVDYVREADCALKYRDFVQQHCHTKDHFYVPRVYQDLSTKKVLTSELIQGIPIDKLEEYEETSNQDVKNSVLERVIKLFFQELFEFNYMQTDPNWSNFFYDFRTDTISLIDFGSSRPYSREFVDKYYALIEAAINNDREKVLRDSLNIGFLSGFESEIFKTAHIDSVMIIGEAIREPNKFDFGKQSVTKRIHELVPLMLRHRLKPPPEEVYSLHRKLSGLFLLLTKLKAQINCRKAFEDASREYRK